MYQRTVREWTGTGHSERRIPPSGMRRRNPIPLCSILSMQPRDISPPHIRSGRFEMTREERFCARTSFRSVYSSQSTQHCCVCRRDWSVPRSCLGTQKKLVAGFTKRYNVTKLVYYETTENPIAAVAREKEIKAWRREKKNRLISSIHPEWRDLYDDLL